MTGTALFPNADAGVAGCALGSAPANLSDSVTLTRFPARGLFVGVGGNVKMTFVDGSVDTWTVQSGQIVPMFVTQVWNTGTTASDIHALYS